jgi:carbonic anhydrase/acetyltransferase-like protein (isoleucine patch superfamily)
VPSTKLIKLGNDVPTFEGKFISPSATIIGRVKVGFNSSVGYGAVVRGFISVLLLLKK